MKTAIINNGRSVPQKIIDLISYSEIEIFDYSEANKVDINKYDLLILSGSSQFPIKYNKEELQKEINLILSSNIPTLGICYGCELIAFAYGGDLKDLGKENKEKAPIIVNVTKEDVIFQGKKHFEVYDAHRWIINSVTNDFLIIAESKHGPEIIKHKNKPMYGFQFHPEKMPDETYGDELFNNFVSEYVK